MRGIWQIILGTVLAVCETARPGHGFWKRQTRYHVYGQDPTALIDTIAVVVYLGCALLIGIGIYRIFTSKPPRAHVSERDSNSELGNES